MKITQVEIFHVHLRPQSGQRPILVKISTDEGIYGLGEAGMAYGKGGSGAAATIKDFAELIIGEDPFNTEKIWERFLKDTFWGQGGGTIIFSAISASAFLVRRDTIGDVLFESSSLCSCFIA